MSNVSECIYTPLGSSNKAKENQYLLINNKNILIQHDNQSNRQNHLEILNISLIYCIQNRNRNQNKNKK